MAATNANTTRVLEFQLICFPGIQSWQHWLSIPLAGLFLVTLAANATLITTIYLTHSLHQPMYLFLCLLSLADLLITFSISPKTFAILWFEQKNTSALACFSQIYLIYLGQGIQVSVFMFLAYDRYVAICNPLRYSSILTNKLAVQATTLMLSSSVIFPLPFPVLAAQLRYCGDTTVAHCFCENVPVVKLSCDSYSVSSLYSLNLFGIILGVNTAVMAFSYIMIIRAVLRLGTSGAGLKAFKTCSSHLILIAFFYSTMIATVVTNRLTQSIPKSINVLFIVLQFAVPPALHPIVYGIRVQKLRHALKKLLRKYR